MTSQETQNKIEEEIITMNVATMNYLTKLITEEMFNKTRKEVIENIMAIAEKREKEVRLETINAFETHLKMGLQTMSVSKDPNKVSMSFAALFKYIESLKEMAKEENK